MAAESKKPTSSIRTYAQDLAAAREKRGPTDPPAKDTTRETEHQVSPIAAAPAPSHKVAPQTIPATPKIQPLPKSKRPAQKAPTSVPVIPPPVKPTKIPAFHELKSRQKSTPRGTRHNVTTSTKHAAIRHDSETISIKEARSQKSGFVATLFGKVGNLFSAKDKTPTLSPVSSNSTQYHTTDSSSVVTLKQQINKEPDPKFEDNPETSWSPYTEPGYDLLESPEGLPEKFEPVAVPEPVIPEPILEEEVEEIPTPVPTPAPEPAPEPAPTPIVSAIEEPTDFVNQEQPVVQEPDPAPAENEPEQPTKTLHQAKPSLIERLDTNTLTIVLVLIVVGTITLALATKFVFERITFNSPVTTVPVKFDSIISPTKTLVTITLTATTTNQLAINIKEAVRNSQSNQSEIAIIAPTGEELTPSYIFNLLNFNTSPSFRQSITNVRFVSGQQSTPVTVFSFTDLDTARGGLLQWEETLAADFSHLFSYSRNEVTNTKFVDDSVAGVDVRLLQSQSEVQLVYGIDTKNNLIIIAPSTEIFSETIKMNSLD